MRDWSNLTGLLLPLRLQGSAKLRRLVQVLTSVTVSEALAGEVRKEELKAEHRMIGQVGVVEALMKERYGDAAELRGHEEGDVVMCGARGSGREIWASKSMVEEGALIVPSVGRSDVGVDFVAVVPEGTDEAEVRMLLDRYVFAGVGYRVEELAND